MAQVLFSIVVCTRNPRRDYFQRVLDGLGAQTFPVDRWELILVDNRSDPPLEGWLDKAHAMPCRIVREESPGLVAARIRGLRESRGDWLVCVDDDNLLSPDYLQELGGLIEAHPQVALWSGEIRPEFEVRPPDATRPFWPYLALTEILETRWSADQAEAPLPCGAGMAVRRDVMECWSGQIATGSTGARLGRSGDSLLAGEDTDIGLTACDLGLGVGVSEKIRLTHLIPARRVEMEYLQRLARSVVYSHTLLDLARHRVSFPGLLRRLIIFTGRLVVRNRTACGLALWRAQVGGLVSAWAHFKFGIGSDS